MATLDPLVLLAPLALLGLLCLWTGSTDMMMHQGTTQLSRERKVIVEILVYLEHQALPMTLTIYQLLGN